RAEAAGSANEGPDTEGVRPLVCSRSCAFGAGVKPGRRIVRLSDVLSGWCANVRAVVAGCGRAAAYPRVYTAGDQHPPCLRAEPRQENTDELPERRRRYGRIPRPGTAAAATIVPGAARSPAGWRRSEDQPAA